MSTCDDSGTVGSCGSQLSNNTRIFENGHHHRKVRPETAEVTFAKSFVTPSIGEKDAMKVDESGETVPKYQEINKEALIPYLVSAIQELSAKVKELESK